MKRRWAAVPFGDLIVGQTWSKKRRGDETMIRTVETACLAFVLAGAFGCAKIDHRATLGRTPMSYTQDLGRPYEVLRGFEQEDRKVWLFFYLWGINDVNGVKLAEQAVNTSGAEGVARLNIQTKFDVLDVIITNLLFGIICTENVHAEGDLVKFK